MRRKARAAAPPPPELTEDGRHLRRIVILYAAATAIPQFVNRLIGGRQFSATAIGAQTQTPLVLEIGAVIAALLAAASALIFFRNFDRTVAYPPPVAIVLLVIVTSVLVFHGRAGLSLPLVGVNLVVLAALSTLKPALSDLRVFAHVGATIAAGSIFFGLLDPAAFRAGSLANDTSKAIIGNGILAGPYPSSNNLGMGMAMALPFVFLVGRGRLRWLELLVMVAALVMSASRSSLLAAAVALVGVALLRGLSAARERATFYGFGAVVILTVSAVLPWTVNSPEAFTRRGAIWMASRRVIELFPVTGAGGNAYDADGAIYERTGLLTPAGHNLLLHYWVVAGLPGLFVIAVLLVWAARAGVWSQATSLVPTGFVLVFLVLSTDEMPFVPEKVIGQEWVSLPALAVVLAGARAARNDSAAKRRRSRASRRSDAGEPIDSPKDARRRRTLA